jgi:hypothetical protein
MADDKDSQKELAQAIAALLPTEVVVRAVGVAIERGFSDLTAGWAGATGITELCREAVKERTRELLRTKYKDQVNEKAELLAAQVVGEMVQYRLNR